MLTHTCKHNAQMTCDNSHCMYNNLYYNNGRWYALLDSPEKSSGWRFSRNQQVVTLHVKDVHTFTESVSAASPCFRVLTSKGLGLTVLILFVTSMPLYQHWSEVR